MKGFRRKACTLQCSASINFIFFLISTAAFNFRIYDSSFVMAHPPEGLLVNHSSSLTLTGGRYYSPSICLKISVCTLSVSPVDFSFIQL